jgi:hypothetical protein
MPAWISSKPAWYWVAIVAVVWVVMMVLWVVLFPQWRGRDYAEKQRQKTGEKQQAVEPAAPTNSATPSAPAGPTPPPFGPEPTKQ